MKESVTYQAIVKEAEANGRVEGRLEGRVEGRVEGEREMLLRFANRRLGPPSSAAVAWLSAIMSAERLIALGDRLLEVESWDELMAA